VRLSEPVLIALRLPDTSRKPPERWSSGWTPDLFDAACPSRAVLDLIADKWSILVRSAIHHGVHRNGELLRRIDGISQKALTRTLHDLEHHGLVCRIDHFEVPPRVEYSLTKTGESLFPLLESPCRWALDHADVVSVANNAGVG
jgi:DNA-binding HxlR family transcriptional regulator